MHPWTTSVQQANGWRMTSSHTWARRASIPAKAGRVLGAWKKIRESDPHLFRHFSIYSQPASNMDGIILSWVIKAMGKEHPVELHQRDCFSAAFSSEVMNMPMRHPAA